MRERGKGRGMGKSKGKVVEDIEEDLLEDVDLVDGKFVLGKRRRRDLSKGHHYSVSHYRGE